MARVSKTLLRRGIYEAPQGTLKASQGRLSNWVKTWREMDAVGIRVPISWGHQPEAVPGSADDRARKQYWLSAFNAGYLDQLTISPDGKLDGKLDCPGVELDGDKLVHWVRLPDGRQVKSAIGEVSIAVKDHVDGTGKKWEDAIVHVALTPLPVAHGHGGFSLSGCTLGDSGFTLSLSNLTHTLSASEGDDMADDADDKDKKKADDSPPPEKKEGEAENTGEPGDKPASIPDMGQKDHFKEALEVLSRHGIALPDDTTNKNAWERICIVGHALEAAGVTGGNPDPADSMDVPPPEEEPANPEDEGETYSGEDEAATEEQRPIMMSLSTTTDPVAKGSIRRIERDHKEALGKRIDKLVERGLRPALADQLRGQVEGYTLGYTLSADGEVEVASKRLDERIGDLELSLPQTHPLRQTRRAKVEVRPDERDALSRSKAQHKTQEEVGDELAAMAGAPQTKRG